jgi:hypothetical protein
MFYWKIRQCRVADISVGGAPMFELGFDDFRGFFAGDYRIDRRGDRRQVVVQRGGTSATGGAEGGGLSGGGERGGDKRRRLAGCQKEGG